MSAETPDIVIGTLVTGRSSHFLPGCGGSWVTVADVVTSAARLLSRITSRPRVSISVPSALSDGHGPAGACAVDHGNGIL